MAQQAPKIARIGVLSVYRTDDDPQYLAFSQKLRELGHVEGKTASIDYLAAEANYDRLPALAAELVRRNADVIMAIGGTPAATAAARATKTIPIVFSFVADPVGQKLVASLARPGGNLTGISNQNPEVAAKSLGLLKEVIPSAKRITVLMNPTQASANTMILGDMQAAARSPGLEIEVANARSADEFEGVFSELARKRPAGLVVISDPKFVSEASRIAALAARHQLPMVSQHSAFPEQGGLMSFGADRLGLIRRAAVLVDKILKGAKPADIPVEQPTTFETIVNLTTAKRLGLRIPQSVLTRADRVIE